MKITYEQAREDHEYLWSVAPAYDMTGGYVDQGDLEKLLRSPTKPTAKECYCNQIRYWFGARPDDNADPGEVPWHDERVREIAERHFVEIPAEYGSEE
jgi:hypothetical protein